MLGLLAILAGVSMLDGGNDGYDDDFGVDEDLKPCTDVWRSLHPYGYNQYTGGWDAEGDHENGW